MASDGPRRRGCAESQPATQGQKKVVPTGTPKSAGTANEPRSSNWYGTTFLDRARKSSTDSGQRVRVASKGRGSRRPPAWGSFFLRQGRDPPGAQKLGRGGQSFPGGKHNSFPGGAGKNCLIWGRNLSRQPGRRRLLPTMSGPDSSISAVSPLFQLRPRPR